MSEKLAKYIDHTALKADTTEADILTLCEEAKQYQFFSVCVNPAFVKIAKKALKDTNVAVCTVIGFPLGANATATKVFEATKAIASGATEIDMVIHIGALKSGKNQVVLEDITAVVEACAGKALVKVIIETSLLTDEEKVTACKLAVAAGADFVKTSTGFSTGGATVSDIALMRQTVGEGIGVKASGGIRDRQGALALIEAGATRLGASSGVALISGEKAASDY